MLAFGTQSVILSVIEGGAKSLHYLSADIAAKRRSINRT
jgi:hypothetical protein